MIPKKDGRYDEDIQKKELSIEKVLVESMEMWFEMYVNSKEHAFLEKACMLIHAYLRMGFAYEDFLDAFDRILSVEYTIIPDVFLQYRPSTRIITANKSQVRSVIGRWNPKRHSHSIDKVVQDIVDKVQNHQIGYYNYWTEHKMGRKNVRYEYELFVQKDRSVFYDRYRNYYYILSEE